MPFCLNGRCVLRNENVLFCASYFTLQYSTQSKEPDTFAENEICFLPDGPQSDTNQVIFSVAAAPRVSSGEKNADSPRFLLSFSFPLPRIGKWSTISVSRAKLLCGMILSSKNRLVKIPASRLWDLCCRRVCLSTRVGTLVYPSLSLLSGLFTLRLNENWERKQRSTTLFCGHTAAKFCD